MREKIFLLSHLLAKHDYVSETNSRDFGKMPNKKFNLFFFLPNASIVQKILSKGCNVDSTKDGGK